MPLIAPKFAGIVTVKVTATGSFTRGDSSTGAIADVVFTVDPFHTRYLGDLSVSEAAAARANLKGYGTLTDLHVAMTLDPDLIDVLDANLPNLDVLDLAASAARRVSVSVDPQPEARTT